jgi:hypothetical protein
MEWIVACDQPFEEVERPEFIAMMNLTRHNSSPLVIPGRNGIKRRLMKMGDETIKDVRRMFSVCCFISSSHTSLIPEQTLEGKVCLSLDAWTSSNQFAFLAIVAHFVSNDGQLGADISLLVD